MVKRSYNLPDTEPEMNQNLLPSERNHTLQVIDVYTCEDKVGQKLNLDKESMSKEIIFKLGLEFLLSIK